MGVQNREDWMNFEKTELKLESGLVKALENESFNQLTVAELVAAAGISRRSFYIYYKDKYEFLYDVRSRILKGIKQAMKPIEKSLNSLKSADCRQMKKSIYQHMMNFIN